MERTIQLKIDLKMQNDHIEPFYKAVCALAKVMGVEVLDDGNAPYIEDMSDFYNKDEDKYALYYDEYCLTTKNGKGGIESCVYDDVETARLVRNSLFADLADVEIIKMSSDGMVETIEE